MIHRAFTSLFVAIGISVAIPAVDRAGSAAPPSAGHPPSSGETAASASALDSLTRLGKSLLWNGRQWGDLHRVVLAESAAYHALEIDSAYVPALNLMSLALTAEGRFEDVLYVQNWSITCELRNPESWGILGDAFMELGKYRDADSCYTRMLAVGQGVRSRVRMARWAFELGDPDEALARIEEAIEAGEAEAAAGETGGSAQRGREPDDDARRDLAEAYVRQGTMLVERGRYDQARYSAEKSLAVAPGFVPALALEAYLFRLERKTSESIRIYERLAAASMDPGFQSALARVHAEKMRGPARGSTTARLVTEAKREYAKRLTEFPRAARSAYAAFLLDWNIDLDRALTIAYEETRRNRSVESYELLARAYYKKKRHDLAWSSIGLALRSGTQNPRILYHAALVAKANGDEEKYKAYAEKARRLNPNCERQYGSF